MFYDNSVCRILAPATLSRGSLPAALVAVLGAVCGLTVGCDQTAGPSCDEHDAEQLWCDSNGLCDCVTGESAQPSSVDQFFSLDHVWAIRILLPEESIAALVREPRTYTPGTVVIAGKRFEEAGVRLKGAYSFQGLDGKAAFKIKLDKFVEGQSYLGLEKFTLNNLRQDRAKLHEYLAYMVYRAAGVPASRVGFVTVTVNDEPYGLYANVESPDEWFLEDRFAEPTGNLYEAPWGADFTPDRVDKFEQDEGRISDRADLHLLVDAIAKGDDDLFFGDDRLLDTETLHRFLAAEVAVGQWDGYRKRNNYYAYHEPARGLWSLIPWGLDTTLERDVQPFEGHGVLIDKCVGSARCLAAYARVGVEVAELYEQLDLAAVVAQASVVIDEALVNDPRSPHPVEQVYRHQDALVAYLERTPARLRARYDCVDPDGNELDRDHDGFGACIDDCNDHSGDAHPGGTELCDGLDNDCNGYVDDSSECDCQEREFDEHSFMFCTNPLPWSRAVSQCAERGGVLARPESLSSSPEVWAMAQSLRPGSWYFGINDRSREGRWVNSQSEPVRTSDWAAGEPDDFGDEDCGVLVEFGDGAWDDVRCVTAHPYICEELSR